jgi:hypothetical protein
MGDGFSKVKAVLYAISDVARFLFTNPWGIVVLFALFTLYASAKLWSAVSDRRLAVKAAGEDFNFPSAIGAALRELSTILAKAACALPTIAGVALALVLVLGLSDSSRRMDDFVAGQKRVAELTATVRNLDRRYKAVEVRIDDASGGRFSATLSFFDYKDPKAAPKTQRVELPGRELFVDALVCNFDYSEISAGREINLAIPFKVFSDEVPESEGVPLSLFDETGTPFMYRRSGSDLYGISNVAFESRLAELMAEIRTDDSARKAGIVRSLYGDAVHRLVQRGDSFTVWVEQTGGLTIKDAASF